MRINRNFFIILLSSLLLASCAKESDPKLVYERYLASIQEMDSFDDRQFEKYISKRAREFVREKISGIQEKQLSSFLIVFKAEAVLPNDIQVTLNKLDQQTSILTIMANDYPEQGSKQKSEISFIQEDGWKIDKIIIETSGSDFTFKSTTY